MKPRSFRLPDSTLDEGLLLPGKGFVISLKKYLDMEIKEPQVAEGATGELLHISLESFRSSLRAMAESGARACPVVGSDLQSRLRVLEDRLQSGITPASLTETGSQVNQELTQWGDRTVEYSNARTVEIKELLILLARTAESVGERDHEYAEHLSYFTTRLRTISNLDDLTQVRFSLVRQAAELKTYVDQMEQDSHKIVANLKTEVSGYETKLKKVEELALRDKLTGLSNRRNVEERIEMRIARTQEFCVVMLDVNRLKLINDKHGHQAGDSMLQQFAQELRSCMRSSDVVGRWGGDEFLLVMDTDTAGASVQLERLQKWVFGEYTIRPGKGSTEVKVKVGASVGLAQWQPGETLAMVVERADAAMYEDKKKSLSGLK